MDAKKVVPMEPQELNDDQLGAVAGGVGAPVSPLKSQNRPPLTLGSRPPDPLEVGGVTHMPPDPLEKGGL